jgi:hypothetical protein
MEQAILKSCCLKVVSCVVYGCKSNPKPQLRPDWAHGGQVCPEGHHMSDSALLNLASTRWHCLFIATIWDFVHQNTFSGCWDMILNTPVCMFSALSFFAWFYQKIHISKNIPQAYKVFPIKPKLSYLSNHWTDLMNKLLDCSYEQAVSSCTYQIRQHQIPDGTCTCYAKQWPTPPSFILLSASNK